MMYITQKKKFDLCHYCSKQRNYYSLNTRSFLSTDMKFLLNHELNISLSI